jgi:LEA14-like dessication related protein
MNRIVTIGFVFIMILTGCAQPKNLEYKGVQNIRINSVSFSKTELGADVKFYNPNTYPMILKDAVAEVFVNNKLIGNVKMDNTFTIPKRDTFLLPVLLNANLGGVLGNLVTALGNKEVTIKMVGNVKAGRINGIFINIPINYEGKQKLNLDF